MLALPRNHALHCGPWSVLLTLLCALQYASQPVEVLSMQQMLTFGRYAAAQPDKVLKSARFVQREVSKCGGPAARSPSHKHTGAQVQCVSEPMAVPCLHGTVPHRQRVWHPNTACAGLGCYPSSQIPKRLARRLLDLQLLP